MRPPRPLSPDAARDRMASRLHQSHGWRPVSAPQKPVLFVNPRSGNGRASRAGLDELARERGIEVVVLTPERSLGDLVDEAVEAGADALGVAGGDGSLAPVAAAACARDIPFVCLPAGTRNHFALDLGVDRSDLVGALDAFTQGVERRIDVAEANGQIFLNNVSLGIYGDAVQSPGYRDAKVQTLVETAGRVLGPSARAPALRLVDDLGRGHNEPAVVLVSNNPYAVGQPLAAATRPSLSSGLLGIIVLDRPVEGPGSPGRAWSARDLAVASDEPIHAGVDGEAVDLDPPLQFIIRPGALRVRISSRHPGASPSALSPAVR
jgi:diacylglycerol kinase family enzyme